jgi:hypothetical protein
VAVGGILHIRFCAGVLYIPRGSLKQAYEEDTSTLKEFREPSEGITEKTEDGLLYVLEMVLGSCWFRKESYDKR